MDLATLGAFLMFVVVMTGTPGPGNLTFMAIGATAGYWRAFPVIVAAQLGDMLLIIAIGFGLGQLMASGGMHVTLFKGLSMAYMCYLAWRLILLNVKPKGDVRLPSFWEGLLIHPLSPKTWAMNVVAYTTFLAGNELTTLQNTSIMIGGFTFGGFVFHSLWALVGVSVLKLLGEGALLRGITIAMALAMLAATAWSLLL